jgi:predicted CoA-binding protein
MSSQDCEFPTSNATSDEIKKILAESKNIAVVGLSRKPDRPSFDIALYLIESGYHVFGVNPGIPEFMGEPVYKSLKDIPGPVDIVDIFRSPDAVPEIVEEAIEKKAKVIWMQSGIVNNAAADRARAAGLKVVMNKCIKVEHATANL